MKIQLLIILTVSAFCCTAQNQLPNMPVVDGTVWCMARHGDIIYIGGNFSQVNGQARSNLASFDAVTGVLTGFNPTFSHSVQSITLVGDKLIAGGAFYQVNGVSHWGICMFDVTTGLLDSWNADGLFDCSGVGVSGNVIYYAKSFGSGLARIEAYDVVAGLPTGWTSDSVFMGEFSAFCVAGNYLYAGGEFDFFGSNSVYRDLCRFDLVTGNLDTSWHPDPATSNYGILKIIEHKGHIYIGGTFTTVDGLSRPGVASFDGSGVLTSFNPQNSSTQIFDVFGYGDNIWIAGNSWQMGGQARWRIAEINPVNSQATCWNASTYTSGWSLGTCIFVCNDTVYASESSGFAVFSGSPKPFIAGGITGPSQVLPLQNVQYSVPMISGHSYYWNVVGGTGSSNTNSISVSWGNGPAGEVSLVQVNPSSPNCQSDTMILNVSIGVTSVYNENAKSELKVYPTLVQDRVFVELSDAGFYVELYNCNGGCVVYYSESERKEIDFSNFKPGLYTLLTKQNRITRAVKVVKL